MARTGRPGLSHEQKAELWRRWKAGETLSDIGRALGKHAASVFGVVAAKGGFAPVPRSRKSGSLSLIEREEISRGLVEGSSFRQLGRDLGRAVSTISREVGGNGGRRAYRATRADERARPCTTSKAPPVGIQSGPVQTGCCKVVGTMVAAADCWVAEGPASRRPFYDGIP